MRRSRNALWLLLAGLAASLLAVRGVAGPERAVVAQPTVAQPVVAPPPRTVLRTSPLGASERCSDWILAHGPVTPPWEMAVVNSTEDRSTTGTCATGELAAEMRAFGHKFGDVVPMMRDFVGSAAKADLEWLHNAWGDFVCRFEDARCLAESVPPTCDWDGLCGDSRHSIGTVESLCLNEQCDGIGDAAPAAAAAVDTSDLALAVSRFSGPRPACIVSEREVERSQPVRQSIAIAPAMIRCGAAIAKQCLRSHESAVSATARATRRAAGQAIGVAFTFWCGNSDRTGRPDRD